MYRIFSDKREQQSADRLAAAAGPLLSSDCSSLTVTQLCREAGVSRSTFYRLFQNTDDVLLYACDRIVEEILSSHLEEIRSGKNTTPSRLFVSAVQSHASAVRWMINHGKTELLLTAHRNGMIRYAGEFFPGMDPSSDEFVFFTDMRFGLMLGAFLAWLETKKRVPLETVAEYADRQIRFVEH